MALGVMHALRSRGLVPGRDLGVIGFDDIPEATNAVPRLTSVATAPATVGREAANCSCGGSRLRPDLPSGS